MDSENTERKEAAIKNCLITLQKLNIDFIGLYNCGLNYNDTILVRSSQSYLNRITTNIKKISSAKKFSESELFKQQETTEKRVRGSLKL